MAAIVAAFVIFGALLVPKIYKAVDAVDHSLQEINVLIQDADEAVQNINKVDFDNLKQSIDDLSALKLARDIANKIEATMSYPGVIKVNVIRETRAVEYAK